MRPDRASGRLTSATGSPRRARPLRVDLELRAEQAAHKRGIGDNFIGVHTCHDVSLLGRGRRGRTREPGNRRPERLTGVAGTASVVKELLV